METVILRRRQTAESFATLDDEINILKRVLQPSHPSATPSAIHQSDQRTLCIEVTLLKSPIQRFVASADSPTSFISSCPPLPIRTDRRLLSPNLVQRRHHPTAERTPIQNLLPLLEYSHSGLRDRVRVLWGLWLLRGVVGRSLALLI